MDTNVWMVIYIYVPMGLYISCILGFIFIVKYDTIKFNIVRENEEEAKLAIMQMYKASVDDSSA